MTIIDHKNVYGNPFDPLFNPFNFDISVKFRRQSTELSCTFLGTVTMIEYCCIIDFQMSERIKHVGPSDYPCVVQDLKTIEIHRTAAYRLVHDADLHTKRRSEWLNIANHPREREERWKRKREQQMFFQNAEAKETKNT